MAVFISEPALEEQLFQPVSSRKRAWRRFAKNRPAVGGLILIVLL